jgi:hypothetical protein
MRKAVSTATDSLYFHVVQPDTVEAPARRAPQPGPWAVHPASNILHVPQFA